MRVLEICAVFGFGVVPTVILCFLMLKSFDPFNDGSWYLVWFAFVVLLVFWILHWFYQMKNAHKQLRATIVREFQPDIEAQIETKSPSATTQMPILGPIFTNLTTTFPIQTAGNVPASVHQSSITSSTDKKGLGASLWYIQPEQPLPSYEVAMGMDVAPPTYADFMSIELST